MPPVRHTAATLGRRTGRAKPASNPQFEQRRDVDVVALRLPSPISVNEIHSRAANGGVRKSDRYVAWLDEAGWKLTAQRPGRISGRYALTFRLPRESGIDLDNGIKATSDLLQLHGVIRNDRDAEEILLCRQDETPDLIVEVRPFVERASA